MNGRDGAAQYAGIWVALLALFAGIDFFVQERLYHYFRMDVPPKGALLAMFMWANDVWRFPLAAIPRTGYADLTYWEGSVPYYSLAALASFVWTMPLFLMVQILPKCAVQLRSVSRPFYAITTASFTFLGMIAMLPYLPDQPTPSPYTDAETFLAVFPLLLAAAYLLRKSLRHRPPVTRADEE